MGDRIIGFRRQNRAHKPLEHIYRSITSKIPASIPCHREKHSLLIFGPELGPELSSFSYITYGCNVKTHKDSPLHDAGDNNETVTEDEIIHIGKILPGEEELWVSKRKDSIRIRYVGINGDDMLDSIHALGIRIGWPENFLEKFFYMARSDLENRDDTSGPSLSIETYIEKIPHLPPLLNKLYRVYCDSVETELHKMSEKISKAVRLGNRHTLLHHIELLQPSGIDLNKLSAETPFLMEAQRYDDSELFKVLLEHGADPNLQDHRGRTVFDRVRKNDAISNILNNHQSALKKN